VERGTKGGEVSLGEYVIILANLPLVDDGDPSGMTSTSSIMILALPDLTETQMFFKRLLLAFQIAVKPA
jgi:hypothetical protein